ncbi:MAG TPA: electron transfer flavoprotein subunit beta, partial [Amycolatopsis sp.]|nr:electron transfer flavoprotein subunit beta [Amycolatopsis sp.]
EANLPAVVSVGEKINEPRYPSFKGIMAAKKKPVETLTVADLGVDAGEVGLGNAWSSVLEASPKPPRTAGERVEDEGDGGSKVAAYLVAQKLI